MSQLPPSVLFDTDPLLRQSVETLGMPEPLAFRFPKKFIGNMAVFGIAATSVLGGYDGLNSDTTEASFDGKLASGEKICFAAGDAAGQPGTPGEVGLYNLTPVGGTRDGGFLVMHSSDAAAPNASNANYGIDTIDPNVAAAKTGRDGKVCVTNSALGGDTVFLIVDKIAKFALGGATAESPVRLLDQRSGIGVETPPPVVPVVEEKNEIFFPPIPMILPGTNISGYLLEKYNRNSNVPTVITTNYFLKFDTFPFDGFSDTFQYYSPIEKCPV